MAFGCSRSAGIVLPGDGGHPRTTAVSVADILGGVIEGQVPGVDRSFAAKSATGRNGSIGVLARVDKRTFRDRRVQSRQL